MPMWLEPESLLMIWIDPIWLRWASKSYFLLFFLGRKIMYLILWLPIQFSFRILKITNTHFFTTNFLFRNYQEFDVWKMFILWKMRVWKCEFCGKWDFQNVNFWIFAPVWERERDKWKVSTCTDGNGNAVVTFLSINCSGNSLLYFMDHMRVWVSETENCKLFPLYSITNL